MWGDQRGGVANGRPSKDGGDDSGSGVPGAASLPFAGLVLVLACVLASGADRYLAPASYAFHIDAILIWADGNEVLAAPVFAAAAAIVFAISLPGAAVLLAIAGGALFGVWAGTALFVAGATCGSIGLFLAARPALGGLVERKDSTLATGAAALFQREAFWLVLAMRLVLAVPQVITTLIAAVLGAPLRSFAAATAAGLTPGTVILAYIGSLQPSGYAPNAEALWLWPNLTVLLGLAALALTPVLARWWWSRRGDV